MLKINEHFYRLHGRDSFIRKEHFHNEIEFIHVIKGRGTLLKNNKTYNFCEDTLFFIDGRNAHIVFPENDDYTRNKIVIDANSFFNFCENLGLKNAIEVLSSSAPVKVDNDRIDKIFEAVSQKCNLGEIDKGFAHRYVIELIEWLYSKVQTCGEKENNSTVQKILNIIAKTRGRTNLTEISEKLYLDKFYICHLFKEKTGVTLTEYISDVLYEEAKKLLDEREKTIEEISYICGFSAPSSFSRFFKNKSGASPNKYRK